MKNTFLLIITCIILLPFLSGCAQIKKNTTYNIPNVAATIPPLYAILKEIAGEHIETQQILPTGASPHTFDVTPETIKQLQNTKLVFMIGHGVDNWMQNIIKTHKDTQLVTVDKNIELIQIKEAHNEHDHGDINPHYWLSPTNAVQIAHTIADSLSQLDPAHANEYKLNTKTFENAIQIKKQGWYNKLDTINDKKIIVFHDAWGYFADYFNINIASSFEPFPGKSPTPKYLAELEHIIKENNITSLFLEPQLSTASMKTFAKDMNVILGTLDPLGGVEGRFTYIDLIDYNINSIVTTLQ